MSQQSIICLILIGIVLLLLLWTLRHPVGQQGTYVMEATEEVDGERTLIANTVIAVLRYAFKDLHIDEPVAATSPDGRRSYFRIVTPEGHVIIQFDWSRDKLRLFHAYHSDEESGMLHSTLKIRNGLVDEVKLADFGHQVADLELKMIEHKLLHSDSFKNLVLQTLAAAAAENSEEEEDENGGEQPPFLV